MTTFSTLGIGSGADLQSMLTKLMAVERAPIDSLQTKIDTTNSQISLYGSLSSKLDSLAMAATTLSLPSQLSALAASSNDETVAKASASFLASEGSYNVTVTSLAAAQKSNTSGYIDGTTFTATGSSKITITIGEPGNTVATDIDLSVGGPYSLADIRNKINTAGIGVRATLVTGADNKQYLALTSTSSGKQGAFSVATTNLTASGGQASLASLTTSTNASDAGMIVDGVEVKSSTNDFTSTVTGVTFSAKALGTTTITVAASTSKISSALQAFVDAFNGAKSLIKANSGYDPATKKGGLFNADTAIRSVLTTLNNSRTQIPSSLASASMKELYQIGITVDQSGLLSLDSTKLSQAMSTDSSGVLALVKAYGNTISDAVNGLKSATGAFSTKTSGLSSLIASYTSQKASLETRVANVEASYRKQFTALDTLMASMQTTSSYLTQQLAGLSR